MTNIGQAFTVAMQSQMLRDLEAEVVRLRLRYLDASFADERSRAVERGRREMRLLIRSTSRPLYAKGREPRTA